ncbi:MAG: Glu/Leu/Phe/Val dehydrogenase [Micavibrio aeruginosavorus]|uniref:Glutamate dehydrogenase n=1 Tax=Micavibrio aeruginosavorus TaxID=349221 RepID=A0A7T5UHF5_9BACT|nr:MAG: Glu/Leu/Phe/Val dehydrogenase [Micavibrio aeruginosavorus]
MSAALKVPQQVGDFEEQLRDLKGRFAAMMPELESIVRDPALGVEGYIVVWNTGISVGGPMERSGKGGTRITQNVTLDEVKMLARTMALKNAAAGLPLGGSKSGLRADPSAPDFEKKYRRFVKLCAPFLRENGGPFGGFGFDIGGRPEHALWACDELKSTTCFTGKPVSMGGTDYDREGIAGLGVAVAGRTMMEIQGVKPSESMFAVQGMGAMGAAVFRYFSETGAQLRALADPKYGGTWMMRSSPGAELKHALICQDKDAVIKLLPQEADKLSDDCESVLYLDADILFPCAVQNVLTETNSVKVKARFVCEGANGPCTEEARTKLHERGIHLVPDFIANSGGVIAAFVELTSKSAAKAEEAKAMTRQKVEANVRELYDLVARHRCEPQQAGLYMALSKILASA